MSGKYVIYTALISLAVVVGYERYQGSHRGA